MRNRFNDRLWAIVGKGFLLLGGLLTLLQLYNYFITDSDNIVTTGYHSDFRMPPDMVEILYDYEYIHNLDKSYESVFGGNSLSINELKTFNDTTQNDPFKKFLNSYSQISEYRTRDIYQSRWIFTIKNNGKKILDNLKLETPFSGVYAIDQEYQKTENGEFSKIINLDNLLPTQSASVTIWTQNAGSDDNEYYEKSSRIFHSNGEQHFDFPLEVRGVYKWLAQINGSNLPIIILITLVIIVLMLPTKET